MERKLEGRKRRAGGFSGAFWGVTAVLLLVSGLAAVEPVRAADMEPVVIDAGDVEGKVVTGMAVVNVPVAGLEQQVRVAADALAVLRGTGTTLVLEAFPVTMSLPPGALPAAGDLELSQSVNLVIPGPRGGDAARRQGLQPASPVLVMSATTLQGGFWTEVLFEENIGISLNYLGLVAEQGQSSLGVYRYIEASDLWEPLEAHFDEPSGTVTVATARLGQFALMAESSPFSDVVGHWAQEDIEIMAARGIAQGVGPREFAPSRPVTRAEFTTLLVRALGLSASSGAGEATGSAYRDVASGAWYAGAVYAGTAAGLVSGVGDGRFAPDENVTRQQVAVMLVRALNYKVAGQVAEPDVSGDEVSFLLGAFADEGEIASWARTGVAAAVKTGLVQGRGENTFAPAATATRAEAVVILRRLLDR